MKKIITIFICILTYTNSAISQNFSIDKGQEFKAIDDSKFNYYIGSDSTGVYMIRTSTKGRGFTRIIQKLDAKTLNVVYSESFHLNDREVGTGTYLQNGKIMAFTTDYIKADQVLYLLLREFDAKTGKIIGEIPRKIANLKSDPLGVGGRNFYVAFSPDQTKMMITNEFKWPKKESEVESVIYETSTVKKLGTKKVINAYAGSTISSFSYKINNDGTLYYLFNYLKDFEEELVGMALASVKPDETETTVTPLPFDKLDIQNGTFEFVNSKLVFCGVFKDVVTKKERRQGKEAKVGVYSFFIDGQTGAVTKKGFDYFPKDVSDKLTYKDGMIEESPAKKYYSFENIFTLNDDVYLMESHSYTISSSNSSSSFERELLVSKFNKEGKMEWMKIIPKFTSNNLNNFNYIIKNNKVYLFYAEHPKNLEKFTVTNYEPKKYATINNYNGSVLVCTSFDESGLLIRKEVFRNEGWCYDPISTNIIMGNNKLLLRMINKDKERYDKISFD